MHLIHDHISRDTVEAAEQILAGVKAGSVVGIAFVLVLKRRKFMVNCAGVAAENPSETRGMVCALDDELQRMVQGRADSNTTL